MEGRQTESPRITQEMIALYDDYTHLSLDRRKFMDNLAKMAGSMTAAVSIAGMMAADAQAQGLSAEDDPNLRALVETRTPVCMIVGKTSTLHVLEVLRTSLEENLKMIEESVAYLVGQGRRVVYDAEHFFDGYRSDAQYALATLEAAKRGCASAEATAPAAAWPTAFRRCAAARATSRERSTASASAAATPISP